VTYGSESDQFDIGVARSSGEILVLSVRYVKMGSGVMVYPFEWFWRNAECISQNRSGERMHRLPSQNVTYGSESDQFDIGVARSSGEILVLSVRYVKMGSGVMVYPFEWFWRNAECISQNRSGERTHRLPSCNAVGKHDVRLGQLHTLGQNTVYPFEWFWRNAQCISQNRSGERMH